MKKILIIVLILMISGCTTREKYFNEQETPAGSVPPLQEDIANRVYDPSALPEGTAVIHGTREKAANPNIISRFRRVYAEQGKPRIAFYLNRELSDNVREWSGKAQVEIGNWESCGWFGCIEDSKNEGRVKIKGTIEKSAGRKSPNEAWVWDFESAFLDSFLAAQAKMVDRATIIRLIDASNKEFDRELPLDKENRTEMGGLLEYTDIIFEVLVTRVPGSNFGYEFKATAKEIRTGMILAIVSSTRWGGGIASNSQAVAVADGYEMNSNLPPVSKVSRKLALELMNKLIQNWEA